MFKILEDKKTRKIIAVDLSTGAVYEEGGVAAVDPVREIETDPNPKTAKKHFKEVKKIKEVKVKASSKKCKECGQKPKAGRYLCKGLCPTCYQRGLYRKKHGDNNQAEKKYKYECIDCGATIDSSLDIDEVKCPRNDSHKMVQK